MRVRFALLITATAVAGLIASAPATAQPIDKGHFHDVVTRLLRLRRHPGPRGRRRARQLPVQPTRRPKHPFPYYRESVHGTIAWTNLNSGGTFTNVFTANRRDHTIVDNGDGTITITLFASGGSRYYDQNGKLVLKDPGEIRFAFEVDYNGTPGNPDDDEEIDGSFRVVRESTGRNDTEGRDFCADLVEFTT